MKLIIQTPGFKASPSLRDYVKKKVEKLDSLKDGIIRADVTLMHEVKGNNEKVICIINISVRGKDLLAKSSSFIFEDAILKTVDILKRKLRKSKTKKLQPRKEAKRTRRAL